MITFRSAVDYLQGNGYLTIVNGQVLITSKFQRELSSVPIEKLELKEKVSDGREIWTKKEVWDKFMRDADVPQKVMATDGRSYTVKQWSLSAQNMLLKIISETPSYELLIRSTKLYYKSNAYKLTFKNYLERDVWRGEYEKLEEASKDDKTLQAHLSMGSGKSKFED